MASDAQIKANKKYHDKFDRLMFRVPIGKKELIADHAESMGESVNAFILRAVENQIENDNKEAK